jgi:soluble lytic murein transglycosylase-like protein
MPKLRNLRKLRTRLRRLRRHAPSGREWLWLLFGGAIVFGGFQAAGAFDKPKTPPNLPLKPVAAAVDIPWLSPTVQRWQQPIGEMAQKYKIDPDLLAIIMTVESGGDAKAKSEAGAIGLMQVTPPTAKDIAKKHILKPVEAFNLEDPHTNIEFGAAYLAWLRDEFGTQDQAPTWNTTVELIAAGYNGGPGAASALDKGDGLHDMQTVSYSRDVFNMWRERHAASSPTYERWLERGGSRLVGKAGQ